METTLVKKATARCAHTKPGMWRVWHKASVAKRTVDFACSSLTLTFKTPRRYYARNRKMTMEEFAIGWNGNQVGQELSGPTWAPRRSHDPRVGRLHRGMF